MSTGAPPSEGDVHTYERTFSKEEVQEFGTLSGDQQPVHTEPDEEGRLLVQGLLTATLPTKIGGDLQFIARRMDLEFVRPVYTGETISCRWENDAVMERDDRYELDISVVCTNEDDIDVLEAAITGLVWKD